MRFSSVILLVLPVLAAAAPLNARESPNTTKDRLNQAANVANQEVADTQNAQAAIKNGGSPAAAEASLQNHLNQGVDLRKQNQGAAQANKRANAQLTSTLSGIESKQNDAQAAINKFTGGSGDAAALASLQSSFEGGNAKLSGAVGQVHG